VLREKGNTFVEVHEDTVPAEHMPTTRHLRGLEFRLQAYRTMQLLFGVVDYLPDFSPLLPLDSFEIGKALELLCSEFCSVEGEP
jgi:hypothetical protein